MNFTEQQNVDSKYFLTQQFHFNFTNTFPTIKIKSLHSDILLDSGHIMLQC